MRRPPTKTIRRVFEWLEEYDMSVYGPCVDLETGQEIGGNMDVNFRQAIKLAELLRKGKTWSEGSS